MRTVSSTDADRLILVGSPVNAFFFGPRFSASVHRAFGLEMKDSHACCQAAEDRGGHGNGALQDQRRVGWPHARGGTVCGRLRLLAMIHLF